MRYMQKDPNPSGAYPGIQTLDYQPDGWLPLANGCDESAMTTHQGYVSRTVVDGEVTAISGDDAAYQAYLASLPAPTTPEPTIEEKNRADIDYLAVMTGVTL